MYARNFYRLVSLFFFVALSFVDARACGYDYVTYCANEMDFTVNGQYTFFYVQSCTWMNNFHNYNFGTVNELTLSKGLNNTWESCDNVVMNATIYYRIYPVGGSPGNFTALNLTQLNLQSSGSYRNRTYTELPNLNILAGLSGGNYYMEVYFRSDVDFNNDNNPDAFLLRDNGGAYYRATFTKPGGGGQCSITGSTSNVQCNNNGTASNPSDDTYSFALTVTGNNTGAGWHTTINGQNQSGAYGTPVTLGPYSIANGNLNFTVVDDASSTCTAAVAVTAPPTCSNTCSISASVSAVQCNNNGTPSNPNDDTFTFNVTVTGSNTGAAWHTIVNGVYQGGSYGTPKSFGPYAISGGNLSFTIIDDGNPSCTTPVSVTAPATCSNQCSISAATSNVLCNDNGSPANPSDDTFTFSLTVTGSNTGAGWHTTINGQNQSGTYGTPKNLGPYAIAGGNLNFTVIDDASSSCTAAVSVTAPPTCSNSTECTISAAAGTATCNNNGTPNDPNDDTYTFALTVTGYNTGAGWTSVIQGQIETGAYGSPVTLGPFPIADGDLFFTVEDDDEINCETSAYIVAPAVCSSQESCEKQVLLVVGVATPLGAGDLAVKNRLEGTIGATVTVVDDNNVVTADAAGKDLVIVSATVSPTKVGSKFRDVTVPVLTWEVELFDDMKMTGAAWGTDYGSRKFVNSTLIANTSHPMAGGLSGTQVVFSTSATAYWANPAASAAKVARIPGAAGSEHWMAWGYETGAAMVGQNAPARRVGFFLNNTSATLLTTEGWALFDAAYGWAVNCSPNQQRPAATDRAQIAPPPSTRADELRLYPNPNSGDLLMVDLASHRGEAAKVVIGNALGQTIRAFELGSAETAEAVALHIEDLDNGQYVLSVQPEGQRKMSKLFFVQR